MSYLDHKYEDAEDDTAAHRMSNSMPKLAYLCLPDMLSSPVRAREIILGGGCNRGYRRPFVGTCGEIRLINVIYRINPGRTSGTYNELTSVRPRKAPGKWYTKS